MFNSPIVDVTIGLILVFMILSLVCSGIQEWVSSLLKLRANNLESGIKALISDDIAKAVYQHGLIKGLAQPGKMPSYIPSQTFTLALFDTLQKGGNTATDIRKMIESVQFEPLKQALRALADEAEGEAAKLKVLVAKWFDSSMDRVSGWYARKAQLFLAIIAVVVTLVINADSIRIAAAVWSNQTLREQLLTTANSIASDGSTSAPSPSNPAIGKVLGIVPIGWACPDDATKICLKENIRWSTLPGWLITIVAVSFGAPFWFDLLSKVGRLKATGTKPKKEQ